MIHHRGDSVHSRAPRSHWQIDLGDGSTFIVAANSVNAGVSQRQTIVGGFADLAPALPMDRSQIDQI